MDMRNVLSEREARQGVAPIPVCHVSGNDADDLDALGRGGVQDGAAAHAVDGDAVNQVCALVLLPRADVAGEETEGVRRDGGESEPPGLHSDRERVVACGGSLIEAHKPDIRLGLEDRVVEGAVIAREAGGLRFVWRGREHLPHFLRLAIDEVNAALVVEQEAPSVA
jgi:hypothetical protein